MRSRDDRATRATRVLRWYPTAWRERYGAELVALLDDTHADASLSVRERCSLARAGSKLLCIVTLSRADVGTCHVNSSSLSVGRHLVSAVFAGTSSALGSTSASRALVIK